MLNLLFACTSVTNNGLLDLAGRVFVYRDLLIETRTHRGSARLPQLQCTLCISGDEYAFDGDDVGSELLHDAADGFENFPESLWKVPVH